MTEFYVYAYYDGSVPVYIGKGHGRRAWQHLDQSISTNAGLQTFLADKRNIGPKILFTTPDEELAFAREIALIAEYGRRDRGTGTLFNRSGGGEGKCWTNAERYRVLLRATGLVRRKPSALRRLQPGTFEWDDAVAKLRETPVSTRPAPKEKIDGSGMELFFYQGKNILSTPGIGLVVAGPGGVEFREGVPVAASMGRVLSTPRNR